MRHTLSSQYDTLYQEHLLAFQRRRANAYCEPKKYTDFYPSIGVPKEKPVEFILYGQSVGGWQAEHDYSTPLAMQHVDRSRDYSNDHFPDRSPLDWVNAMWSKGYWSRLDPEEREYYFNRFGDYRSSSPFWQLIWKVIARKCSLGEEDNSWTERLVWSNLYKIAPQDGREHPNPSEEDRVLQRPECVGLVEQELRELRPKYCIVYTNDSWWAPFRKGLMRGLEEVPLKERLDGFVQRVEQWEDTRIVVVKRSKVASNKAVDDILKCLE